MTLAGDNLTRVKRTNRSALLRALHQNGAMSRKRLAQALSLTPAAITKITADMLHEGLIRERGTLATMLREMEERGFDGGLAIIDLCLNK